MNPIVEAALIAGGTTAIVGVAGFLTTLAITRRTLDAARDDRLWDKRAAAYEGALAEVMNRQAKLSRALVLAQDSSTPPGMLAEYAEYLATEDTPAWSGRLAAYASPKVVEALEAALSADSAASAGLEPLRKAVEEALPLLRASGDSLPAQAAYLEQIQPAWEPLLPALGESGQCYRALIDLIRTELLPAQERKSLFG